MFYTYTDVTIDSQTTRLAVIAPIKSPRSLPHSCFRRRITKPALYWNLDERKQGALRIVLNFETHRAKVPCIYVYIGTTLMYLGTSSWGNTRRKPAETPFWLLRELMVVCCDERRVIKTETLRISPAVLHFRGVREARCLPNDVVD